MWSAIVDVEVENAENAEQEVRDQVIPMVKQSPGFIAGYWMNLDDHRGTSCVVFETEENARAAAPAEGPGPMPGVTITSVRFARVIGNA